MIHHISPQTFTEGLCHAELCPYFDSLERWRGPAMIARIVLVWIFVWSEIGGDEVNVTPFRTYVGEKDSLFGFSISEIESDSIKW